MAQAPLPVPYARSASGFSTGRSACATAQLLSLVKEGRPEGGVVGQFDVCGVVEFDVEAALRRHWAR